MSQREELGGRTWSARSRSRLADAAPPHRHQRRRRHCIGLAADEASRPGPSVRRFYRSPVGDTAG
jgi:hypothetical protein